MSTCKHWNKSWRPDASIDASHWFNSKSWCVWSLGLISMFTNKHIVYRSDEANKTSRTKQSPEQMAASAIEFFKGEFFSVVERDSIANYFAGLLFPLLLDEDEQDSQQSTSPIEDDDSEVDPSSGMSPFLDDLALSMCESAIFCSVYLKNPHSKVLKSYFSKYRICRKHVFRFLKNYCLLISKKSVNIQFAILHSLALVYELIYFCRKRGQAKYRDFFPLWWEYVFNKIFKEQFYDDGGWKSLESYCKRPLTDHITEVDFRNYWNLASETLGCDFSVLELSDTDDFPYSEYSD